MLYIGERLHQWLGAVTLNWKPVRSSIRRYEGRVDDVGMALRIGVDKAIYRQDDIVDGNNSLQTVRQRCIVAVSTMSAISPAAADFLAPSPHDLQHSPVSLQSDRSGHLRLRKPFFLNQTKTLPVPCNEVDL